MSRSGFCQFLHPDCLEPLPVTLDSKKSPLALLAQTCSSIGNDPSAATPTIPHVDTRGITSSDRPGPNNRPSSLHCERHTGDCDQTSKQRFRCLPSRDICRCMPVYTERARDSRGNNCVTCKQNCHRQQAYFSSSPPSSFSQTVSNSVTGSGSTISSVSVGSSGGHRSSPHNERPQESRDHTAQPPRSDNGGMSGLSAHVSPLGAPRFSASTVFSGQGAPMPKPLATHPTLFPGLPSAHHRAADFPSWAHLGLDPGLYSYYHDALAAHSSSAASAAAQSSAAADLKVAGGSALSSHLLYARVRTPSGATSLVPMCQDPYCRNCQLTGQSSSHLSSNSCTSPNCSTCVPPSPASLRSASSQGMGRRSLPAIPPMFSTSSSAAVPGGLTGVWSLHGQHPAAAHQRPPRRYVCGWEMAGAASCGKRCASSEELMQHLKTHSPVQDHPVLAAYRALGLHSGLMPSAAGCHGVYTRFSRSPNSRRPDPSCLNPLNHLMNANRYHPYNKPLGVVSPCLMAQGPAAVGPYYSPYSASGHILGAAVVP